MNKRCAVCEKEIDLAEECAVKRLVKYAWENKIKREWFHLKCYRANMEWHQKGV